jgi:hypothetical protein
VSLQACRRSGRTQSDPWIRLNPRAACQEGAPVRLRTPLEASQAIAAELPKGCAKKTYISANIAAKPPFGVVEDLAQGKI